MGMRVDGQDFSVSARSIANPVSQGLGEEAFAVIGDHDGVDRGHDAVQMRDGALDVRGRGGGYAFAVDAHHLLVAGDDAGLDGGGESGVLLTAEVSMPAAMSRSSKRRPD